MKIVEALNVLKNMCKNHVNCNTCPCAITRCSERGTPIYCCGLTDYAPRTWVIKDEPCFIEDDYDSVSMKHYNDLEDGEMFVLAYYSGTSNEPYFEKGIFQKCVDMDYVLWYNDGVWKKSFEHFKHIVDGSAFIIQYVPRAFCLEDTIDAILED